MGGEHSGVTEATTDVLIECAYFDPDRDRADGPEARPDQRRAQPLRARRRSGVPRHGPGAGDAAGARALRRRGHRRSSAPARRRIATSTVDYRPGARAGAGRRRHPPDRQQAILERLGFGVEDGDTGASTVPIMAPRRRRRGRHRRGGRPHRRLSTRSPAVPLPRTPGVARPTATPEQKVERKVRRTAAARGLNEAVTWSFICRSRSRAVRRRRLDPRKSDQRGHEGDAALACSRACSPPPAAISIAARRACGCSRSAAAISPTASGRRSAWCWRATAAPAIGAAARRRASPPLTPRPRRSRSSPPPARGRESADARRRLGRLPSRPLGTALPRTEECARRVRRTASGDAQGIRPRRAGRGRRDFPRCGAGEACLGSHARSLSRRRRCRR